VAVSSFDNDSVDSYADVFANAGNGTLGAPVGSDVGWETVNGIQAGVIGGSGRADIAFTSQDGQGYALNSGGGMFGTLVLQSSWSSAFVMGDLNGDHVVDEVSPDPVMGACVELNNGNGQFGTATCYAPLAQSIPDTVAIGDVDGKNGPDLLAIYTGSGGTLSGDNFNVYLNQGNGTFGSTIPGTLAEILSAVVLADMNNDGKADIVAYDTYGTAEAFVVLSNGDGTFGAPAQYPLGGQGTTIAVGDFLGNGLRGMAALNGSTVSVITATCK